MLIFEYFSNIAEYLLKYCFNHLDWYFEYHRIKFVYIILLISNKTNSLSSLVFFVH